MYFLHSGARIRSFLTEPYMLYFVAFYSRVLYNYLADIIVAKLYFFSRQFAKSNRALFKSV